jgi:hypothetical protein
MERANNQKPAFFNKKYGAVDLKGAQKANHFKRPTILAIGIGNAPNRTKE